MVRQIWQDHSPKHLCGQNETMDGFKRVLVTLTENQNIDGLFKCSANFSVLWIKWFLGIIVVWYTSNVPFAISVEGAEKGNRLNCNKSNSCLSYFAMIKDRSSLLLCVLGSSSTKWQYHVGLLLGTHSYVKNMTSEGYLIQYKRKLISAFCMMNDNCYIPLRMNRTIDSIFPAAAIPIPSNTGCLKSSI